MAPRVAVVGYGIEGRSAAKYWSDQGAKITVCDANPDLKLPDEFEGKIGQSYLKGLDQFDLVVRSQSVRISQIQKENPDLSPEKMTSVTEEFLSQRRSKVIGVTGTKGKGTVSSLIAAILQQAGKTVWLGGNIGKSPLDFLGQIRDDDWVVLELSSFQLMDCQYSPHIGVMLMVGQDHLDWHSDMSEYIEAKSNIFNHQQGEDIAVYFAKDPESTRLAQRSPGQKIPYFEKSGAWIDGKAIRYGSTEICHVSDVALVGSHNLQNVCAAVAATWTIIQDPEPIKEAIRNFKGLEHRLELVRELDGVKYYNDSFSTNPGTAIAAIEAFEQSKVLVLGGRDKGMQYSQLAKSVASGNVRAVIAIGELAPTIKRELEGVGYHEVIEGLTDMLSIVLKAHEIALSGDAVLLSPGAASFDMFSSYKDRGEQFRAIVHQLA